MKKTFVLAVLLLAATPLAAQQKPAASPPDSTGTYEMRAVTVPPRPLNVRDLLTALETTYPPELREAAVNGMVQVRMRINASGVPDDLKVMSSTDRRFDAPTLEAVRKLRFSPAEVDGRPVPVWVVLPIEWTVG